MNIKLFIGIFLSCCTLTNAQNILASFDKDTIFTGTETFLTRADTIVASNCKVTFRGKIDGGAGTTHIRVNLHHAVFFFDSSGYFNDQLDAINGRPSYFNGDGLTDTFNFSPKFNVDQTHFDTTKAWQDQTNWVHDGLSVPNYSNCVLITRASQNLPSIYKMGNSTTLSHHGLLSFDTSGIAPGSEHLDTTKWIISDNDQQYDGGFSWAIPLMLTAQKNIKFTGINIAGVAAVITGNIRSVPLVKNGPGDLNFTCSLGFQAGARIDVREGSVTFNTDPGDLYSPGDTDLTSATQLYVITNPGQFLTLNVAPAGTVNFLAGGTIYDWHRRIYLPIEHRNGVQALISAGTIAVGEGNLDITDNLILTSANQLQFTKYSPRCSVTVAGQAQVNGTLSVSSSGLEKTIYPLIKAIGGINGTFSSTQLPQGCVLVYETNAIKLDARNITTAVSPVAMHVRGVLTLQNIRGGIRITNPLHYHGALTVTTVDGRIVFSAKLDGSDIQNIVIDKVRRGMYIVKIANKRGVLIQKICNYSAT